MSQKIFLLLIFIANWCFADSCTFSISPYSSEVKKAVEKIRYNQEFYELEARKNFLYDLPPKKEKWQSVYHDQFNALIAKKKNTCRYADVYHDILLFEERIELIKNYRYESCYQSYMQPGWAYTKKEKEILISKERSRLKENAQHCKDCLFECSNKITEAFVDLYEGLIKDRKTPIGLYHDYGLLAYLNNNFEKSIDLLSNLIDTANKEEKIENLDAKMYHDLGSVCLEAMVYNKAVEYLTEAINLDPGNKQIHFDRAVAYFETGSFDLAIQDYLNSDSGLEISKSMSRAPDEFAEALLKSATQSSSEAIVDFVPCLCSSAYGLNKTYWTNFWNVHPLNTDALGNIKDFANACYEITESIVDYCQNFDTENLDGFVEHIKTLYHNYDQLSDSEKGTLIGSCIGKYGIDIFAGGMIIKGSKLIKGYQHLKNANRIKNFETMLASNANKEALMSSAAKHALDREAYLKILKIEWDKQRKHIVGSHNFVPQKSIFEHPNPESLLKKFAGRGTPVRESFGQPGYQEMVDFQEIIGYYVCETTGEKTITSWGKIHYSKNGAHIVPTKPRK